MTALSHDQYRAIVHGLYSVVLGLLGGVFLIYSALDEVAIWPFGAWSWLLPGDVSLWRAMHTGPLLNGVLAIVLVYVSHSLGASFKQARHIAYAVILMVWGNALFYVFRIWGETRGLAVESQQFGYGNLADFIAMCSASIAMVTTFYAVILLIVLGLNKLRSLS
ncbi:hypothetical protein [Pseudoteredinibacter isoporae]|uniref:Styrene-oxide isomerase n=1 Tax=Pseudoteredinibacter isoporae TaxID=570281 RepID=A0A7X0JSF4_9GAMM|nr:hypothetical protein [Pseudoteredinibacter isoporae]MBB6520555.1 styrene-oxide isomerase [Pseudoteredinibacter isoporae]NHO86122.1 hypothetical protein [Pseudoteredinibacter isoporae]NIB25427.1 hypothetical protein [Pseudoteredinibacter isoporae]